MSGTQITRLPTLAGEILMAVNWNAPPEVALEGVRVYETKNPRCNAVASTVSLSKDTSTEAILDRSSAEIMPCVLPSCRSTQPNNQERAQAIYAQSTHPSGVHLVLPSFCTEKVPRPLD